MGYGKQNVFSNFVSPPPHLYPDFYPRVSMAASRAMTQTSRDPELTMQWFQNSVLSSVSKLRTRKYCEGNSDCVSDVIKAHWCLLNVVNRFVSNNQPPVRQARPLVAATTLQYEMLSLPSFYKGQLFS